MIRQYFRGLTVALLCGMVVLLGCTSVRDAGPAAGISDVIENFRVVEDGKIYAGARVQSPEGFRTLHALGVTSLLTLERELFEPVPGEVTPERRLAQAMGFHVLHVPMHPIFAPAPEELNRAVALLSDPTTQPVFVHCNEGVDRTGMVIAAYRVLVQGWSPARAYAEWKARGFHHIRLFWWTDVFFTYATHPTRGPAAATP